MKTAVLLTGHYRTFDQCKETLIPELTKKFNPDFFVNTYIERYNYHPYVAAAIDCTTESHISEDYFSELNYRSSLFDSIDYANTNPNEGLRCGFNWAIDNYNFPVVKADAKGTPSSEIYAKGGPGNNWILRKW